MKSVQQQLNGENMVNWKSEKESWADMMSVATATITPKPSSSAKIGAAPGYSSPIGFSGWSGSSSWNPSLSGNLFSNDPEPIIEAAKYYWVEEKKTGKIFIGMEEHIIFSDKSDGIFWRVYGRNLDVGMYESGVLFSGDDKEMVIYYEVIEEICPPTTKW
jgi:hypothetical protein